MSVYVEQNSTLAPFYSKESWCILSSIEQSIKTKIEKYGIPLKNWDINIYRGIITGYNEAFIITEEKKNELVSLDPKSAEIIRPILRGRDIKRYHYEFANLFLIATFPSLQYNIDNYPAIKKHLLSFGIERLEQTGKRYFINGEEIHARKKTQNKWFETQDSISYWDDFSKPKIVWGNLCQSAQYTIAEDFLFVSAPSPIITGANKYILALLNSKLLDWYIRQLGVTRNGGYFEYKPMFVEKLPIPRIDIDKQLPFINLVDTIINNKTNGIDCSKDEALIDKMVFDLYDLTEEERRFVLEY